MALKLVKVHTFATRVTANIPTEKPGVTRQETFSATFRHIGQTELDQVLDDLEDKVINHSDVLDRYLVGLTDVVDEDGKAIEFETAKEAIKEDVNLNNAVAGAFVRALHGSKEKNSRRSRGR